MTLDLATIDKRYLAARTGKDGRGLLTPIARMYYPNFFTARHMSKKADESKKKKFGVTLFIPNTCDLKLLKERAQEAAMAEWGSKSKEMKLKNPFLKAEDYKYEGLLPGWTMLRLTTTLKPDVLDTVKGSLVKLVEEDAEKVYSGRWCSCDVTAKAYGEAGNRGVTFYLNHVLLLNHDDNLSGRMKAEDLFEAPEGDFEEEDGKATVDSMF